MALFPVYPISSVFAVTKSAPKVKPVAGIINSFAIESVTGSAIYYVGGSNESGNQEGTQLAPFASLATAMQTINALGEGNYELHVQGDTIETEELQIGDGSAKINVTVLGPDSGFATVKRDSNQLGNMFRVVSGSSLTFGRASDPVDSNRLIIDGNYKTNILNAEATTNYSSAGTILMNYGNTILNNGVTLQNNKGGYEHIAGGAIYNDSGTFTMNGGSIELNYSERGGAIYNNTMANVRITGGILIGNTAQSGGAIYNDDTASLQLSGGSIKGNSALDQFGDGIYNKYAGKVQLSENIRISDDICLIASQEITSTPYIIIGGALTVMNAVYHVTKKLDTSGTLTDDVNVGDQGLQGTESYFITDADASKFRFQTTELINNREYVVNSAGYLTRSISDFVVTVTPGAIIYNGMNQMVEEITLMDGDITLMPGIEYMIYLSNNINAGVNTAKGTITGIGFYTGTKDFYFSIEPAQVIKINTAAPTDQTFTASEGLTAEELKGKIGLTEVEVETAGGKIKTPITWSMTSGAYNNKGGSYTYTGTLAANSNLKPSNLTLTAGITVTPSSPALPQLTGIQVAEGTGTAMHAAELGELILPTSGTYPWVIGNQNLSLNYTVSWAASTTLNRTIVGASVDFAGTVSYSNLPVWATPPMNPTITRTVTVIAKTAENPIPNPDIAPVPSLTATPTPTPTPIPVSETVVLNNGEGELEVMILSIPEPITPTVRLLETVVLF
jgi:hypothetical protein